MNLLELPVLFYLATIIAFVTGTISESSILLASIYTANRIIHSLVHVSYNNVQHRFVLFGLSNIFLLILWLQLVLEICKKL